MITTAAAEQVYKLIQTELRQRPDASVAALCRKHKASYSGFRHWYKKQDSNGHDAGPPPKVHGADSEAKIHFELSLDDIIAAILSDQPGVYIPIENVMGKLTPETRQVLGRLRHHKR